MIKILILLQTTISEHCILCTSFYLNYLNLITTSKQFYNDYLLSKSKRILLRIFLPEEYFIILTFLQEDAI